jgi:hypothetical protein
MIRCCSLFISPCSSSNVVFTSFPPLASFAEIGFVRGRPGKWFSACTLPGHGEPLHPGIRPCDGTRQRGDPRPARMGSRPAGRLGPCRTALRDELALPSDVVGPRLQRPFRRLGSRLASLIIRLRWRPLFPFRSTATQGCTQAKWSPEASFSRNVMRQRGRRLSRAMLAPTSAVNLKFLSLLAANSFRNFKFKTALES